MHKAANALNPQQEGGAFASRHQMPRIRLAVGSSQGCSAEAARQPQPPARHAYRAGNAWPAEPAVTVGSWSLPSAQATLSCDVEPRPGSNPSRSDPDDLDTGHVVVVRVLRHDRNAVGDRGSSDPAVVDRGLPPSRLEPGDQKGPCFGHRLIDGEGFELLRELV